MVGKVIREPERRQFATLKDVPKWFQGEAEVGGVPMSFSGGDMLRKSQDNLVPPTTPAERKLRK